MYHFTPLSTNCKTSKCPISASRLIWGHILDVFLYFQVFRFYFCCQKQLKMKSFEKYSYVKILHVMTNRFVIRKSDNGIDYAEYKLNRVLPTHTGQVPTQLKESTRMYLELVQEVNIQYHPSWQVLCTHKMSVNKFRMCHLLDNQLHMQPG